MKSILTIWLLTLCSILSAPLDLTSKDFLLEVQEGKHPGVSIVEKFGRNSAVGTTMVPVCDGGFYLTPTPSNAVTLEVISTDANDTAAGTGAREVTLVYLDATGALQTGTIATNGTSASTETIAGVWRLLRAYVSDSGTYATQSAPSQAGAITIRVESAGDTWGTIPLAVTGFGSGQSLIGAYTVPDGHTAYIIGKRIFVDSQKTADIFFFKRENADDETAGYSPIRVQNEYVGIAAPAALNNRTWARVEANTDIGFMAVVASGTADVSVEFDLLLIEDGALKP